MTEQPIVIAPRTSLRWVRRFVEAGSEQEASGLLAEMSREYGLRGYLLTALPATTSTELLPHVLATNWPVEMLSSYDEAGLVLGSPVIRHLRGSTNPFTFDAVSTNSSRLDGKTEIATGLFRQYGLSRGAYFPAHNPLGQRGALAFAGDRPALAHMEMAELNAIANLVFTKVLECRADADAQVPLSGREIECLSWVSAGKTSIEISGILGLSEYTVNHYLNRATRKLDAVNRVQAVAKAIRAGLLT